MVVGITGGLGCGKSSVAQALERRGFRRLDSDLIVREQLLVQPRIIEGLRQRYGDDVLEPSDRPGTWRVNRTALAARVFNYG